MMTFLVHEEGDVFAVRKEGPMDLHEDPFLYYISENGKLVEVGWRDASEYQRAAKAEQAGGPKR